MEHFYYDRIEKKDPDPTLNRIGTEYYRGLNHELLDSVKFGKHWIPLLDELFTELDEIWYNHPNKLVRRFGKQVARTPKEVLEELAERVVKAEGPLRRGNDWGIPVPAWDKFNKVMAQGFERIGAMDCWDNPDYGLNVVWQKGLRPMKQKQYKNNFYKLTEFEGVNDEHRAS